MSDNCSGDLGNIIIIGYNCWLLFSCCLLCGHRCGIKLHYCYLLSDNCSGELRNIKCSLPHVYYLSVMTWSLVYTWRDSYYCRLFTAKWTYEELSAYGLAVGKMITGLYVYSPDPVAYICKCMREWIVIIIVYLQQIDI